MQLTLVRYIPKKYGDDEELQSAKLYPRGHGFQDGCVRLEMQSVEGVAWMEGLVPKIPPLKEGGSGYKYLPPGTKPYRHYRAFSRQVSLLDPEKGPNFFVRDLLRANPALRKGSFTAKVMRQDLHRGQMSAVMLCHVSSDLVPYIDSMENKLLHGVGTVRMEPYELASRVISGAGPEEGTIEPSDEDMPDDEEVEQLLKEAVTLRAETDEDREERERLQKRQEEIDRERKKAVEETKRREKVKKEIDLKKQKEDRLRKEKDKIVKEIKDKEKK